jgi:sporulation protein YlmC with PRC-barrel domain
MAQFLIGIIVVCLGVILTTVGGYMAKDGWEKMHRKQNEPNEVYNVESHNQKGGITTGKIENINILTDKESLGIREPDGLYQNGKKVGSVINFIADEKKGTFSITKIEFDQPLRDAGVVWQPYEYQNYVIQIQNIDSLVTMMPPGAEGVKGVILNKK